MRTTKKKAFTIMELMTVVVIVGVMAAFAVPNFARTMDASHEQDAVTQLTLIHAANHFRHTQEGTYWPATIAEGDSIDEINTALSLSLMNTGVAYTCAPGAIVGQTYTCTATRGTFSSVLTEAPLSNTNPGVPCGSSSC
jgi:prepilin-type N-terminal cleavage/methylation domain-containing protein